MSKKLKDLKWETVALEGFPASVTENLQGFVGLEECTIYGLEKERKNSKKVCLFPCLFSPEDFYFRCGVRFSENTVLQIRMGEDHFCFINFLSLIEFSSNTSIYISCGQTFSTRGQTDNINSTGVFNN